jgi:hypothetical protein
LRIRGWRRRLLSWQGKTLRGSEPRLRQLRELEWKRRLQREQGWRLRLRLV